MEALAAHVTLIQAEAERLAQSLSTLSPETWRQPSACQGWEVRGAVVDTYDIVVEHGRCRMEPASALAAQVTFRAEAETFALALYQRLPLTVATATGSLVVEGDDELTTAFHRWLQGG